VILNQTFNDQAALAEAWENRVADEATLHPVSYANCVVTKPWGYEFEMFDDTKHALWLLHINAQRATSLHCHMHKTASFLPLSDGLQIVTLSGVIPLERGLKVVAKPGVFHSVWNSAMTDGELIEVENPSIKTDLIRAQDAWGRQKQGYEGEKHIVRGWELAKANYGYCQLKEHYPVFRLGHKIEVDDEGFHVRRMVNA
jgi:hypothetical protein